MSNPILPGWGAIRKATSSSEPETHPPAEVLPSITQNTQIPPSPQTTHPATPSPAIPQTHTLAYQTKTDTNASLETPEILLPPEKSFSLEPIDNPDEGINLQRFKHSLPSKEELDDIWKQLMGTVAETGATDILFRKNTIHIRIDTLLKPWAKFREETYNALIFHHFAKEHPDILEEDGEVDYAIETFGNRLRANTFKTHTGLSCAYRPLRDKAIPWRDNGLSDHVIEKLKHAHNGLILVTGPTGSGKSTTICSMIEYLNEARYEHIITIEDPIEYIFTERNCIVDQREVGKHTKSFEKALRAAMRENPDIIFVGEIRDLETVDIALKAAETGHLVFATLHTTRVYQTISRILSMIPEARMKEIRNLLSNNLLIVICQRLLPKKKGGLWPAREIMFMNAAIGNLIRSGGEKQINSCLLSASNDKDGMMEWNKCLQIASASNIISSAIATTFEETGDAI